MHEELIKMDAQSDSKIKRWIEMKVKITSGKLGSLNIKNVPDLF